MSPPKMPHLAYYFELKEIENWPKKSQLFTFPEWSNISNVFIFFVREIFINTFTCTRKRAILHNLYHLTFFDFYRHSIHQIFTRRIYLPSHYHNLSAPLPQTPKFLPIPFRSSGCCINSSHLAASLGLMCLWDSHWVPLELHLFLSS